MFSEYRRFLYGFFALFFVLVTPFLVIYSLGFEVNLDQQRISNTLSINIETLPRRATVKNRDFTVGKTPLEIKAGDNQQVPIKIEQPGFHSEEFVFWSPLNTNSSARVSSLTLLPTGSDDIVSFGSVKPLAILSSNLLLLEEEEKFYIQSYNVGGLSGLKNPIISPGNISVQKTNWVLLADNIYWNKSDNILLVNINNVWKFIDLSSLPVQPENIVSTSEIQVMLLDTSGKLWTMDLISNDFSFLESSVQGIYSTTSPENIWLWKEDVIYRLPKGYTEINGFTLNDKFFSQNNLLTNQPNSDGNIVLQDFYVSSIFQGVAFKVGKVVYYVPDFNKNLWQVLVTDALKASTDGNTIFWLDSDKNIFSYNFSLKEETYFGKVDLKGNPETYELFYYFTWKRLMLYSDTEVYSVWFNKDILNRNLVKYKPIKWINLNCYPKIVDRFQFCQTEDRLVAFKNTNFF